MSKRLTRKSELKMLREIIVLSLHYQLIHEMMVDIDSFEELNPVKKLRVMELMRLGQKPNEHLARAV